MKQKYNFLVAGITCSFGWIFIQAIYLYFVLQYSLIQWLTLLPGLFISIILVWYTVALFKNKIIIINFNLSMLLVLYAAGLFLMLTLGLLALLNIAGYPLPRNLVFPILDITDKYFFGFITRATLGASLIQIIALITSTLPDKSKTIVR